MTTLSVALVALDWVRELAASLLSVVLPFDLAVTAPTLGTLSTGLLVVLLVLPAFSYRYAVRTFDRYTLG